MRGASAIQDVLADMPTLPLRVFVVWEPVIVTDIAAPTSNRLSLVHDPRAIQYWDRGKALSKDIMRAVRADPARYSVPKDIDEHSVVWDVVALFPRGVTWDRDIPVPSYYAGPVVDAVARLRVTLDEATSPGK